MSRRSPIIVDQQLDASAKATSRASPSRSDSVSSSIVRRSSARANGSYRVSTQTQAATVFWDQISVDQCGAKLGVRLAGIELREQPYDYEQALVQAPAANRGSLIVMTSPIFSAIVRAWPSLP